MAYSESGVFDKTADVSGSYGNDDEVTFSQDGGYGGVTISGSGQDVYLFGNTWKASNNSS